MSLNKLAIKQAGLKTLNDFSQFLPILVGMLLLISLLIKAVPKNFYLNLFSGNSLLDSLIGAIFGSMATGNPITSYIIGEIMMLGKRFAVTRYLVSFILAMAVAGLTVLTLNIL